MVYHKEHNKMAENDLSIRSSAAEYLTYIASTGNTDESIEIRYEDENIRLTQKMMAVLYDVEAHTINYHIKKILEDNELNAEIGIELLNTFKVIIDLAKNGEECIKILEKMPEGYYDLILMDIQMPIMDGYEATKIIRSFNNKNAQIPIIAMTANAFEEDRKHALQLGMNEHLAKPVDIEKLKDVLTKYFNHEKREK